MIFQMQSVTSSLPGEDWGWAGSGRAEGEYVSLHSGIIENMSNKNDNSLWPHLFDGLTADYY